jgi:hypothetical protein
MARTAESQLGAVAHTCNPSYLGGWSRKDFGSRPAQANTSQTPSKTKSWAQCFTPVIQAMWEAEIRKIVAPGQPRQKSSWDPPTPRHLNKKCLAWWHKPVIPETIRSIKWRITHSSGQLGKKVRCHLQNNWTKNSWECSSSNRLPV